MLAVVSVAGLLPLIGPLLIAVFIDEAAAGATQSRLILLAVGYIGLGLARQLIAVAVAWVSTDLAWHVTNELRSTLTRHVLGLDLGFHRSTSPGELVSRVDGDVTALSEFISDFLARAAAALATLVGLLIVVTWRSWTIGVAMAAYLAVALAAMWLMRDRAVSEAASEQAATGRMLGEIEERLTGADDLRSNGGGSHAVATFQAASAAVLRSTLNRERQGVSLWVMSNAVFVLGGIAVLAADAALLRRGSITLGTAFLLFQYTQVLRDPLDRLADETEQVQRAAGGMSRTLQLLDERSTIADDGQRHLPDGALDLTLDGVCFEYADEDDPTRVVHELSLHLAAGRSLGVLGRTGSGKTTLARLLLRWSSRPLARSDSAACRSLTFEWPTSGPAPASCRKTFTSSGHPFATTSHSSTTRSPTISSARRCQNSDCSTGSTRCRRGWTPSSGRLVPGCPAARVN